MKRFAIGILMILAASMIMASTAAKDLYVPAASRATGAFATDWKSDVRAFNPGTTAATVNITYLPMAQWASQYATIQVLIDPGETLVMENILQEDFGLTPNTAGALHFVSNVDIYVESRVYTPNKNGAPGTFGQRIPGVPANQAVAATESVDVLYVDNIASETTGFRTNFGLVAVEGAVNYTLAAFNQNGDPIGTPFNGSVAANQWDQYNALGKLGVTADTQYARVKFTVTSGKAIPYASQADNASGDAVYIDGTKIKSSGGGGTSGCGTAAPMYGYFQQYNNGNWEGNINHPLLWWVDDFSVWAWQDNTPENPDDDDWYYYANYITPTNYVLGLPYGGALDPPLAITVDQPFDITFSMTYNDGTSDILSVTWHLTGTYTCPNYVSGNMDALVKALSPDWKDYAGKWYWRYEGGVK